MRVNTSAQDGINVQDEDADATSVLNFWRSMLKVRKNHAEVLVHGTFQLVDEANEKVFSFVKTSPDGKDKALVVCNFADEENRVPEFEGVELAEAMLLLDNVSGDGKKSGDDERRKQYLQPWEGRIYLID